jgi:hypothetical protein
MTTVSEADREGGYLFEQGKNLIARRGLIGYFRAEQDG